MKRILHFCLCILSPASIKQCLPAFLTRALPGGRVHPELAPLPSIQDLCENEWSLTSPTYAGISVPGSVPGHVHLDLMAAGVIPDPLFGNNDYELRWVAYQNWTYTTTIELADTSDGTSTWLLFNGLDTFASIKICDQFVASTENQFRQYFFDISRILPTCDGLLTLSINFGSAVNISQAISELPGQEVWPPETEGIFVFPNRQFIRKEQSDFGWDWGPAFSPAGIWQPAYLIQLPRRAIYIRNTLLDIYRQGQLNNLPPDQNAPWIVNASLDVIGNPPPNIKMNIEVLDLKNETIAAKSADRISSSKFTISGNISLDGSAFKLWWPSGLGEQNLYNIRIIVKDEEDTILATVVKRSGFRTIVLNMEPISEVQLASGIAPGANWHFEINGHEFYAKGSNFIPPDVFWPRVTPTKMLRLFKAVVDGNQNMLRVWASGAYTPDFIFDIADECGILLWSEFEFGDALYPVNPEFVENVREEAHYNVRRVNHHPSLALWAGGNELENLELPTAGPDPRWRAEYEQLFLDVLFPSVFTNSKSISYIPSSTTNGYLSLNFSRPQPMIMRYNQKAPGHIYGDTDHYAYDSSIAFNLSSYPIGRFANEFGFHSMPSIHSWRQAVPESELSLNSTMILLRNHHYPPGGPTPDWNRSVKGMKEMISAVERYIPIPVHQNETKNFTTWCWNTQLFQALYYRSQISYYRRGSGLPERQLGSLYWQLEDIWQAPSWSGIEYDGRWKILHYLAKDIYQPVIIASYWDSQTGNLSAFVTSDLWVEAAGTAMVQWWDLNGTALAPEQYVPFLVGPLNTTQVFQANTSILPYDLASSILRLRISATGIQPNAASPSFFSHTSIFHDWKLNSVTLQDPELSLTYTLSTPALSPPTHTFTVRAIKAVAAFVWLDLPPDVLGNFEDNGFWLFPGELEERVINVTLEDDGEDPDWWRRVTVRSLWDNYIN
ncbi:Beta-mannosidase A [Podosphaera aphanis]|nr:Beta-mannosidase A [Podosphaera aphanis]